LAVLLVLAAVGAGAEVWARHQTESVIAASLADADADADADSHVTVHGFPVPVLLQLARGQLDDITITAPAAGFDGMRLEDLSVHAEGVSTTSPSTVRNFTTTALLPTEEIRAKVEPVVGQQVELSIRDGLLRIGSELPGLNLALAFEVSVIPDGLRLDPVAVGLGDEAIPVDALPFGIGDWVGPIVVPVALQDGLVLDAVEIEPEGARITVSGRDVVMDESLLGATEG